MHHLVNSAFDAWLDLLETSGVGKDKEFANKRSRLEKLYKQMEHLKIQGYYHQLVHESNLRWAADRWMIQGSVYKR